MGEQKKLENLDSFQAEIAAMKEAEEKAKTEKKPTTAHFLAWKGVEFNPEELIEDDKEVWEKYKNGTLDEESYNAYNEKLKSSPEINDSRLQFGAFLANKAQEIFLRGFLDKKQ
jgi:hypothetical protein